MATTAKIEIELNALLVDEINRLREAVKAACADFECVSWGHDGDCGSGKIMEKLEETIQAEQPAMSQYDGGSCDKKKRQQSR